MNKVTQVTETGPGGDATGERKVGGFTVEIRIAVSEALVAGLLCCAWEGGSNYWVDGCDRRPYTVEGDYLVLPVTVVVGREDFDADESGLPVVMGGDDDGGGVNYVLDREAVIRGLQYLASGVDANGHPLQPRHWANVLASVVDDGACEYDAETGDVFLQLCLFGEVVYG
jgi:hypothetical protein